VRVFVQRSELDVDLPEILRATRRYFDVTLDVEALTRIPNQGVEVRIRLRSDKHDFGAVLAIKSRRADAADLEAARIAEQRGRAAGMSQLADRCPTIWEVSAEGPDSELAGLNLCAILAAVGLGPVLPDDGSTLFGVRGAMERLEKLLQSR
jgi:hypothetical protein